MPMRRLLLILALGLLICRSASAGLLVPDASFAFAPPSTEQAEVLNLIRAATAALGFEEEDRMSPPSNLGFGVGFRSRAKMRISFIGMATCVTVSINSFASGLSEQEARERAQNVQSDLISQLRTLVGGQLLLFRPDRIEALCTGEL